MLNSRVGRLSVFVIGLNRFRLPTTEIIGLQFICIIDVHIIYIDSAH